MQFLLSMMPREDYISRNVPKQFDNSGAVCLWRDNLGLRVELWTNVNTLTDVTMGVSDLQLDKNVGK